MTSQDVESLADLVHLGVDAAQHPVADARRADEPTSG